MSPINLTYPSWHFASWGRASASSVCGSHWHKAGEQSARIPACWTGAWGWLVHETKPSGLCCLGMETYFSELRYWLPARSSYLQVIPAKKQLSSPNFGFPQAHLLMENSAISVSRVMMAGTEYPMIVFLRCLVSLWPTCPLLMDWDYVSEATFH